MTNKMAPETVVIAEMRSLMNAVGTSSPRYSQLARWISLLAAAPEPPSVESRPAPVGVVDEVAAAVVLAQKRFEAQKYSNAPAWDELAPETQQFWIDHATRNPRLTPVTEVMVGLAESAFIKAGPDLTKSIRAAITAALTPAASVAESVVVAPDVRTKMGDPAYSLAAVRAMQDGLALPTKGRYCDDGETLEWCARDLVDAVSAYHHTTNGHHSRWMQEAAQRVISVLCRPPSPPVAVELTGEEADYLRQLEMHIQGDATGSMVVMDQAMARGLASIIRRLAASPVSGGKG